MQEYDFIVVGAGPAGCVVATRLAEAFFRPSVLLLEAGGKNDSVEQMSRDAMYRVAFEPKTPLNWGFKTAPQTQLKGQKVIDYSRGKGLGGSTAINFCAWTVGPRDDFDEWARLVGDNAFSWLNVQRCLKRVERLHPQVPQDFEEFIKPDLEDHGTDGLVNVSYQGNWQASVKTVFRAAEQALDRVNPDVNSGDPIGMGMGTQCVHDNARVTASSSYLANHPSNLTVITDAHVAKVLLEGKAAKGVRTVDGREFTARREVVVSGGALSSPQLLLLSGIGPVAELAKHGIELKHELPHVGQNLQDHCASPVGIFINKIDEAPEQKPSPMGWFKIPAAMTYPEFAYLPADVQKFLKLPTVPLWELCTHTRPSFVTNLEVKLGQDNQFFGAAALLMSPQSRGTVTLQSSDPLQKPLFDPRFLSHPFDKRVFIESVRQMMKFCQAPAMKEKTVGYEFYPKGETDEEIWEHISTSLISSWHMSSTVRMGRDAKDACVDSSFRVFGLQNLRVVDIGVCPMVPSTHTQTTAYILGEIAAEKLIKEYQTSK